MKVLRVYHEGRNPAHRERDRALAERGVEITLVVPQTWPAADDLFPEPFDVVELPTRRTGDINRHRFSDPTAVASLVQRWQPDVVDLHEEPFSAVVHQVLRRLPADQPVVAYTAQNIDKRLPPPFKQWERAALARIQGMYPCSNQAASVAVGHGFNGVVQVLPLAAPPSKGAGVQEPPVRELRMLMVGRLVAEKGVLDAVRVLAAARRTRRATLTLVGGGPEVAAGRELAASLGVSDHLETHPWLGYDELCEHYRRAQIVLVPSRTTRTWAEQFGRVAVEAQDAGAVVVGYASGALPEVVGEAGVLVPEGDCTALAAAVRDVCDDAARWLFLREKGLRMATHRTWSAVATAQVELYQQSIVHGAYTRDIRPQRRRATARFGGPAHVGSGRPFALPYLRSDTRVTQALGRLSDTLETPEKLIALDAPRKRLSVVYVDRSHPRSGGAVALARLIAALPEVDAHVILSEHSIVSEHSIASEDSVLGEHSLVGEFSLARARLEAAGATVEVLAPRWRARGTDHAGGGGAGTALRATAESAAYTVLLSRRLRALRPDLVHTNSSAADCYGGVAARLARRPVLCHVRERVTTDHLRPRVVRATRFLLARVPDLVLCNSAATAATVGAPVRVIADTYAPSDELSLRAPDGRSRGAATGLVVGMVGSIAPRNGHEILIRAVSRAVVSMPGIRVRIFGSPLPGGHAYLEVLNDAVRDLGLEAHVEFAGFVDDVEKEFAALDVLVHASTVPESSGQVIIEGMAAGLAVIAADAGAVREIVTNGTDGLMVPPNDHLALAAALERLSDPALRADLGAAARQRARDFIPKVVGSEVYDLYRELVHPTPSLLRRVGGRHLDRAAV